jgi:hypothetical protein
MMKTDRELLDATLRAAGSLAVLADQTAGRLLSVSTTSDTVPGHAGWVMVTKESIDEHREFVDVTFPARLQSLRDSLRQIIDQAFSPTFTKTQGETE